MPPLPSGDAVPAGVVAADMLEGERVRDAYGAEVGVIEDVMIDLALGRAAYAVIALADPMDRQLTVPWSALTHDPVRGGFELAAEAGKS